MDNYQTPIKVTVGEGRGMPADMPATPGVTQAMGVDAVKFTGAAVPSPGIGPAGNCPNCEID